MPDEPKLLATSRGPSLFGFGHEVLLARINKIAPLYMRIKKQKSPVIRRIPEISSPVIMVLYVISPFVDSMNMQFLSLIIVQSVDYILPGRRY